MSQDWYFLLMIYCILLCCLPRVMISGGWNGLHIRAILSVKVGKKGEFQELRLLCKVGSEDGSLNKA